MSERSYPRSFFVLNGQLGGLKGGKTRMARMSAGERAAFARQGGYARWARRSRVSWEVTAFAAVRCRRVTGTDQRFYRDEAHGCYFFRPVPLDAAAGKRETLIITVGAYTTLLDIADAVEAFEATLSPQDRF